MKYPLIELRKAYYDALNTVLPVCDGQVTSGTQSSNYIVLGEAVMIPQKDKSNFFNEVVLTIDVVNKTYNTGYKEVSEFVNDVTAIINQDTLLTMPSFVMDNQVIEDMHDFNNLNDKEKVFRTIIRVRSYITEK